MNFSLQPAIQLFSLHCENAAVGLLLAFFFGCFICFHEQFRCHRYQTAAGHIAVNGNCGYTSLLKIWQLNQTLELGSQIGTF